MYLDFAEKQLEDIKNQPKESKGASTMTRGPGGANVVVKKGTDAHDPKHTDQVMYSCGSLATRAKKGSSNGACFNLIGGSLFHSLFVL